MSTLAIMSCNKCQDLCIRFPISQPHELRRAIEISKQNVEDGTICEVPDTHSVSQVSFSDLAAGKPWGDMVILRFRCNSCGEVFTLHAETYHGSGGSWEPENRSVVREGLWALGGGNLDTHLTASARNPQFPSWVAPDHSGPKTPPE